MANTSHFDCDSPYCCSDGSESERQAFKENGPCGNKHCPYHLPAYFRNSEDKLCLNCLDDVQRAERWEP